MCMATAVDGSPVTVTSYSWIASDCYVRSGGVLNPCFYSVVTSGQNITSSGLLATDVGTVICTANIDGMDYTSDPLTLRISGEQLHSNIHCLTGSLRVSVEFNLNHHHNLSLTLYFI